MIWLVMVELLKLSGSVKNKDIGRDDSGKNKEIKKLYFVSIEETRVE